MFVVGICDGGRAEQIALPSIVATAPDARVERREYQRSIASAYNSILDVAQDLPDLDFVVLIHDDVELHPGWEQGVRDALTEGVEIVGAIGGEGPGGMAWFSRRHKHGSINDPEVPYLADPVEVDVVDGLLIAMSPEAVRSLRFDDTYPAWHGYDADICAQARAVGGRVVVNRIAVTHHTAGIYGTARSHAAWVRSTLHWSLKWGHARHPLLTRLRMALLPVELRLRPSTRASRRRLVP